MDQKKIGNYIAEKRKALGLTQIDLAGRLGMSNKSVSKWERGICLPDVSVYEDLCDTLGISINEFLAGEDIAPQDMTRKTDETIMTVAEDGNKRSRRFRRISVLLAVIALSVVLLFVWFLNKEGYLLNNYIKICDENSSEYHAAVLLNPTESIAIYKFSADSGINKLQLKVYEFENGVLKSKDNHGEMTVPVDKADRRTEGVIGLSLDMRDNDLSIACGIENENYSLSETQIMDGQEAPGLLSKRREGTVRIEDGKEIPLCLYSLAHDDFMPYGSLDEIFADSEAALKGGNTSVIVTVTFSGDQDPAS